MNQYEEKPRIIEAALWQGSSAADAIAFCTEHGLPNFPVGCQKNRTGLCVVQSTGTTRVAVSGEDYVMKVNGQLQVMPVDEFEATYQQVSTDG